MNTDTHRVWCKGNQLWTDMGGCAHIGGEAEDYLVRRGIQVVFVGVQSNDSSSIRTVLGSGQTSREETSGGVEVETMRRRGLLWVLAASLQLVYA